ncbi:hypothetical protein ECC02_010251 [Trypanosoma cruzi]|uniref:Uncharacterized protein n=1 Tax=Trypanosoma cruzi TaxID=5693 RepID=A0A7J6XR06_TRYCR|nr:hypothetical protein ECC02_010251 [Trypanosoma cruzi]
MKQHNASKGAECRHPVRQRHGAFLAMYKAKATKQLSSAIVISSSSFALLFLGASSLSKTPAAAAVEHDAAALIPTERQGRECGIVCREHSDCHRRRRPSWHRHHFSTERQPTSLVTKNVLAEHCATTYVCGCLLEKLKREGAQGGTSAQQEAQLDGSDACGTASTSTITHGGSTHKRKILKTRRQGVAVCVALRVSARPGRKETKQEGKKCVLRPTGPRRTPTRHGSLSAPFVAAPPHACSRRGAQGRRHERVGGCASGAVGRETHGTPHGKSAARNN